MDSDVVDAEIHEVKYEPKRLVGLIDSVGLGKPMTQDQITALLTTKFKEWEYEREWRMFARLDERAPEDGLYYLNFDPHLRLREVILGACCQATVQEFAKKVPRSTDPVDVFKARPAFESFRIVRQKLVEPVIVA
ncbi:hypothetical protein [Cupriavidus basilensis]